MRNERKNKLQLSTHNSKGITLVALIITIIVLLILAVVAIRQVSGNGIIAHAKNAAKQTDIASIEEQIRMDILSEQIKVNGSKLSEEQINEILNKYGTLTEVEGKKILITDKNYEIDVTDIISEFTTNGSGEIIREAGLYNSDTGEIILSWAEFLAESGASVDSNGEFNSSETGWTNFNATEYASSNLTVVLSNNVKSLGSASFGFMKRGPGSELTNLTNIVIPDSVTSIKIGAFWYSPKLTSINIPDSVTSIGDHAFNSCSSLTSINIPNSVTSIENSTFEQCTGLTSINIPDSVTSIGDHAFNSCSSLTSINIPNSVTSIGSYAFSSCTSLTSINIPNSVTSIGDHAFYSCSSLTSINVSENNTVYDSRNNCNAIIKTANNELIAGCSETVIPNSVTSIGGSAFYNCTGLTSINIPNSVKTIGSTAFSGCTSLTSITIPNSVKTIGSAAFSICTSLTSITIPNSVTSIGNNTFSKCTNLTEIYYSGTATGAPWGASNATVISE